MNHMEKMGACWSKKLTKKEVETQMNETERLYYIAEKEKLPYNVISDLVIYFKHYLDMKPMIVDTKKFESFWELESETKLPEELKGSLEITFLEYFQEFCIIFREDYFFEKVKEEKGWEILEKYHRGYLLKKIFEPENAKEEMVEAIQDDINIVNDLFNNKENRHLQMMNFIGVALIEEIEQLYKSPE